MRINFEELKGRVGFGLAVVLFDKKGLLEQEFLDNLIFDQWLEVHNSALMGSNLIKTALNGMSKKAKTFKQWLKVHNSAIGISNDLEKTALDEMIKNGIFSQWLKIYYSSIAESDLEKTALDEMTKKGTFNQWLEAYNSVPETVAGNLMKTFASTGMSEKAESLEQWYKIYNSAPMGTDLKKTALDGMSKLV